MSRFRTALLETVTVMWFVMLLPGVSAQEASLEELTERANAWISERITSLGKPEIADGVSVELFIANEFDSQGEWIAGILFEILIDGSKDDKYTYGSVGTGESRDGARRNAVEEWLATFGVAFCDSIADADNFLPLDGLVAYSGLLGVRGVLPEGGLASFGISAEDILHCIAPILPDLAENGIVTIDFKITVQPTGIVDGECRCNGKAAPVLFSRLLILDWPTGELPYMVKQYFVVKLVAN